MVTLSDKTITEYIENTLAKLPKNIKNTVTTQYISLKDYIRENKPADVVLINCIDLYIFGICLINELVNYPDISPILDAVNEIFITINAYLYKKQYESEKSFVSYEPDTKSVIEKILKQQQPVFVESTNIPEISGDTLKNMNSIAIPKLDPEIITTAKLLKTTGLMNPEIAKLIGNGCFNNVITLPLINFSLSNQFVVRCRKSEDYDIVYYSGPRDNNYVNNINIELYKNIIVKHSDGKDESVINKYYLFYFIIENNKLTTPIFLKNSIAHLEFKPGYLENLKKELAKPLKERYVFTFGTFTTFKSSMFDVIGHNHRCALIFDKKERHIYFFDTALESATFLYMFENNKLLENSINVACMYKFGSIDFIKNSGYKFVMSNIEMQYHDMAYKDIVTASTYYRYYKKKQNNQSLYMDWSGGYCGAYVLLLLVMISINPQLDISMIFLLFNMITKGPYSNHRFLILLIRSFAKQIENIIYNKGVQIELDTLDFKAYITAKGKTFKLGKDMAINLQAGPLNYNEIAPLNIHDEIGRYFVRESNINTLTENKYAVRDKKIQSIYLGNISLMFTTIGAMFKKINKIQTQMTQEQRQWQFEHYGPGDAIYFIKY